MRSNLINLILAFTALSGNNVLCQNRIKRKMYAMCPPNFMQIGSECYYISTEEVNWLDAHFECKDKNSKLAEPYKLADRQLRKFLNANDRERKEIWIGGTYDWKSNKWQWGYSGDEITYQSFSKMDPGWSARSCVNRNRFICQHKMPKVSEKNREKIYVRWNETYPNQLANEILLEVIDYNENGYRIQRKVRPIDEGVVFRGMNKSARAIKKIRRRRPLVTQQPNKGSNNFINEVGIENDIISPSFEPNHTLKKNNIPLIKTTISPKFIKLKNDQFNNKDSQMLNNSTLNETTWKRKPRQRTKFDREAERQRRKELQRQKRRKHKKIKAEQERIRKEKETKEQNNKILEEQEKLQLINVEEKKKQAEEIEKLKQQQAEAIEIEVREEKLRNKIIEETKNKEENLKNKFDELNYEQQQREKGIRIEKHHLLLDQNQKNYDDYKKIEEDRRKIEKERHQEELIRIEEEKQRRLEKQKARDDEIKRREELLQKQQEEEESIAKMKELKEAEEKKHKEEIIRKAKIEQLRIAEKQQKEEEEKLRKQQILKNYQKQQELEIQTSQTTNKNNERTSEDEKKLRMQKLRERLQKLSPEEQKRFFELRQKRKKQINEKYENEATIPE